MAKKKQLDDIFRKLENDYKKYIESEKDEKDYQTNFLILGSKSYIFLLTIPKCNKNQFTKRNILTQLENNFLKINKEQKEQKDLDELPENNQQITYYLVEENYKENNEQHIHVLIIYPTRITFTTKQKIEKMFGILNINNEIIIPHINIIAKPGYTYVIQYLMKEDVNPFFNFQPHFLLNLVKKIEKIDLQIKEKLINIFLKDLNSHNFISTDLIKREDIKDVTQLDLNERNERNEKILNRDKEKLEEIEHNLIKTIKNTNLTIIQNSKQDIILFIHNILLYTGKFIIDMEGPDDFSYVQSCIRCCELNKKTNESLLFIPYSNNFNQNDLITMLKTNMIKINGQKNILPCSKILFESDSNLIEKLIENISSKNMC